MTGCGSLSAHLMKTTHCLMSWRTRKTNKDNERTIARGHDRPRVRLRKRGLITYLCTRTYCTFVQESDVRAITAARFDPQQPSCSDSTRTANEDPAIRT